ncbi:MAG TPA: LacI family DNA-binding transcriptional regulator [Armatimonadota bacterium]|jgi:DNA-binding LacI/PurR family transcriptional regulator
MSLREIAEEAGVSITTVSRVINNTALHKVSEDTRQRVLEIARTRRFRPNRQAVSLASRRPPNTIGLVMPYHSHVFDSFYFSQIACAVADVATAHDMDVNLLVSREARSGGYLDFLSGQRVAGAILMGTEMGDEIVPHARAAEVPFIVINNNVPIPGVDVVTCNNGAGAWEMTRHLAKLGHTRIGFIAGPVRLLDAHDRLDGYRQALVEACLCDDDELIANGNFNEKDGREAMRRLLSLDRRPTAVFAANDESAIGAMQVLKREGMRVPDDMAVVGFDDIPLAQYIDPALTTVHQPFYRLGETAAELLIARIRGEAPSEADAHHVIRTRLVIRESCGGRSVRI